MCNSEESECCEEATTEDACTQVFAVQVLTTVAAPTQFGLLILKAPSRAFLFRFWWIQAALAHLLAPLCQ